MPPFRPRRSLRPVRPRLGRRAALWYLAAAVLALATGLLVRATLTRAAAAEAAYGRTRPVVVVTRPLEAGDTVGPDDVEVRPWPVALAPDGALDREPRGRTALVALSPGEALLGDRVSRGEGPASLLAPDQRAVAVPLAVTGLPLVPGDRVDVLRGGAVGAGPDGDLPGGPRPAEVVAARATVLGEEEGVVVLAVGRTAAGEVAAALTEGPVVVALRPPGR